jgi:uncharacterized tellurite resistance protein B-like protein
MFLVELNEKERKTFLGLALHAMKSSGTVTDEEKAIFQSYAYECEMPEYETKAGALSTLVRAAKAFTKSKRRIILMELWGIILADDKVDESEAEWMNQLSSDLDFSAAQARRLERWAKDFIDMIGDGYRLVEGS